MIRFPAEDIRTDRLTLRPLVPSDAAEMVEVLADPELYTFTGGEAPDLETLEQRYRAQVGGPPDGDEIWLNWIARSNQDHRAVGFVQATVVHQAADVAWVVGAKHQRRGFASEAAQAMSRWLAANGVRHITAHIHPRHVASQKVAIAIGLSATGETDKDGETIWETRDRRA